MKFLYKEGVDFEISRYYEHNDPLNLNGRFLFTLLVTL